MKGGNQQPAIDSSEHISPDDGENIHAKRVGSYVWNGTGWERQSSLKTNPPSNPVVASVSDSAASVQLIAANANRKGTEFYNTSSAILYLLKGAGTASATNFTVALNRDDYYESDFTGAFQGVWESDAGGLVLITEST